MWGDGAFDGPLYRRNEPTRFRDMFLKNGAHSSLSGSCCVDVLFSSPDPALYPKNDEAAFVLTDLTPYMAAEFFFFFPLLFCQNSNITIMYWKSSHLVFSCSVLLRVYSVWFVSDDWLESGSDFPPKGAKQLWTEPSEGLLCWFCRVKGGFALRWQCVLVLHSWVIREDASQWFYTWI